MSHYWIQFYDRAPGTIDAKDREEALADGAKFGKVHAVNVLPYPRAPVLVGTSGVPSFCFGGDECLGRSCCPRRRACDD